MNRPIKFRAWDKEERRMITWDEMTGYTLYHLLHSEHDGRAVAMQFTGLFDKNGIEIYEGDILEDQINKCRGVVKYIPMYGAYKVHDETGDYDLKQFEGKLDYTFVIGNIYENPELLPLHNREHSQ